MGIERSDADSAAMKKRVPDTGAKTDKKEKVTDLNEKLMARSVSSVNCTLAGSFVERKHIRGKQCRFSALHLRSGVIHAMSRRAAEPADWAGARLQGLVESRVALPCLLTL